MRIGIITKQELLKSPKGHQSHISGCGTHRDRRKCPKGNRNSHNRKIINEY